MRLTSEPRDFLADPEGRVLLGSCWAYFCAHPGLFGFVMWGRPDGEAVQALVRALRVELRPDVPPHASLVDVSRVESVDTAAFEALATYVTQEAVGLKSAVTRLALVRPPGFAGAVATGFYEVLDTRPYPVEVVDTAADGLRWLGESVSLAQELEDWVVQARDSSSFVLRLRAWLGEHLRDAELAAAARALAVSERTLQRRLRDASTTFGAELLAVRLTEVKHRLLDSDRSIGDLAFEAGFSSSQHLSRTFKKHTGRTPSQWREEAR